MSKQNKTLIFQLIETYYNSEDSKSKHLICVQMLPRKSPSVPNGKS